MMSDRHNKLNSHYTFTLIKKNKTKQKTALEVFGNLN